jgi:hypothetical protein
MLNESDLHDLMNNGSIVKLRKHLIFLCGYPFIVKIDGYQFIWFDAIELFDEIIRSVGLHCVFKGDHGALK